MKILIEVMHGLGDVVCILPLIENIRLSYPDAYITVIVNSEGGKEIIENANFYVDKIVVLHVHKDNKQKILKICMQLRKDKYDIGICAINTPVKKAYAFMAIIAPKRKVGVQFSKKQDWTTLEDNIHFVEANLLSLNELNLVPHVKEPLLIPNEAVLGLLREKVNHKKTEKGIVGVCIGNADTTFRYKLIRKKPVYTRGWGIANMSGLCKVLLEEKYNVVLIGGKQELPLLEQMPAEVKEKSISLVGKTSMTESIALASLCDVVIGVDTGMQHVADAVGTKTVSIFGPTFEKYHGAHHSNIAKFVVYNGNCRGCFKTANYTKCKDRRCLNEITVQQVFDAVKESTQMEQDGDKHK